MRKKVFYSAVIRWLILIFSIIIAVTVFMVRSRPTVLAYAKTRAESIMTSAFDEAVQAAIRNLNYSYSDMAVITRGKDNLVTSVEIDYLKLNLLRAEISKRVYDIMAQKSDNKLCIPLGTLLGNEYTAGYGPDIRFNIQFLQIPSLDFGTKLLSAGINNVLHQITVKARLSYSVVMRGVDETFSVSLTAIAAQTVIAGAVPENFTNVTETPESNIADDIFNFSGR